MLTFLSTFSIQTAQNVDVIEQGRQPYPSRGPKTNSAKSDGPY